MVLVAFAATATPMSTAAGDPTPATTPLTVQLDQSTIYGQFSPDSKYWVELIDNDDTLGEELYAVPLDGSEPPHRLSPELGTPEDMVTWFEITPDGATVVFAQGPHRGSDDYLGRALYAVPIVGGPVTPVTPWIQTDDVV